MVPVLIRSAKQYSKLIYQFQDPTIVEDYQVSMIRSKERHSRHQLHLHICVDQIYSVLRDQHECPKFELCYPIPQKQLNLDLWDEILMRRLYLRVLFDKVIC